MKENHKLPKIIDNEEDLPKIIDNEEDLLQFMEEQRAIFEEIKNKSENPNEKDKLELAELVIENFSHASSLEEFDDLSDIIINLASPDNPLSVRLLIANKLNFDYFKTTPIGYETYEKLILLLIKDPDEKIQSLIFELADGDVYKHLTKVKSDPEYIEAMSLFADTIYQPSLDFYQGLQDQIAALGSALDYYNTVQDQVMALGSALDVAQDQIMALGSALDYSKDLQNQVIAATSISLPSLNYIDIAKTLAEFTPFWEEDEYKSFEYNWVGFYSTNTIKQIYEEYKKGNEEAVKEFFFEMFQNKDVLNKIKEDFKSNTQFASRINVIEDALDVHLEGKYTLSIPILLSQIDGIFIKEFKSVLKGKHKGTCSECERSLAPMPNAKNIAIELLKELDDDNFSSNYLEFIKKDYNKNRIPILHGLKTDYADQDYSTKLILALYQLFHILK